MSNFRKAKKHGGVSVTTVMKCVKPTDTVAKCINALLVRDGFLRVKVPGDGNCFYHALAKFLKLSHIGPDTHKDLRKKVVDKMEQNIADISPYLIINNSNIKSDNANANVKREAKYLDELNVLRKDKVWASDTADLVSQYAAKALDMRIKIYDVKAPVETFKRYLSRNNNGIKKYENIPAQPRQIVCYTFEPENDVGITVHLLRISDGHYELLYPKDRNNVGEAAANLDELKINARTTRKKTARSPSPRGAAAATSRSPPPRTSTTTRRQRKTSLERALEQIAIAESKEAASRRSPSPPKAAAMPKAVTRRRPRVAPQRETSLERNLRLIAEAESSEQTKSKKLNNNFFLRLDDAKLDR